MIFIIVLFTDATFQIYPRSRNIIKSTFQKGARFFEVKEDVTVLDISDWYAKNFVHRLFREI